MELHLQACTMVTHFKTIKIQILSKLNASWQNYLFRAMNYFVALRRSEEVPLAKYYDLRIHFTMMVSETWMLTFKDFCIPVNSVSADLSPSSPHSYFTLRKVKGIILPRVCVCVYVAVCLYVCLLISVFVCCKITAESMIKFVWKLLLVTNIPMEDK